MMRWFGPWKRLLLDAASGRDNLLTSAGAHLESLHGNRRSDRAVREHLDLSLVLIDQAGLDERVPRDLAAQLRQVVQADDLRLLAERVREPTLRKTARDRHLAAFEMRLAAARTVVARARLDTLVTLTRRLAGARTRAATETLAVLGRSRGGAQVVQPDLLARGGLVGLCLDAH